MRKVASTQLCLASVKSYSVGGVTRCQSMLTSKYEAAKLHSVLYGCSAD